MGSSWEKLQIDGNEMRMYNGIPDSVGASIRVPTPDTPEPLSIGWVFPPGRSGWIGLKDVTLGVDIVSASKRLSVERSIDSYRLGIL